jgi:outer membrane beta-barrel protein
MRTLLSAALLFAGIAHASPLFHAPARALLNAPLAQTPSSAEDDDEDDSPATTSGPAPAPTGPAATPGTAPAPADAPAAVTATSPAAPVTTPSVDQQKLVFGAPLYNPNVGVHTVEKKQFADKGTHELVLYPAWVQVNGKFTNHAGSGITYLYHLQENFALQLSPIYNWYNAESGLNAELIDKARVEAQAATSLLLNWGATAGVEVTPLYGKFAFYEGSLAHISLVISGGAGVGGTRHQLKPASVDAAGVESAATFGDTGAKFVGQVGGGLRVQLGTRFTLRLEVRDLVYSAQVSAVNGCSVADLTTIKSQTDAGKPASAAEGKVGGGCRISEFGKDGADVRADVNLARNLVTTPSSDVLNNVGFYAGLGFIF